MRNRQALSSTTAGATWRGSSVALPVEEQGGSTSAASLATRDRLNHHRAEIDGLRALAVLAVLCFHLRIFGFSGGFVGVDVFFVISGFLITKIVVADIDGGRFSLAQFYRRRARRLLPALFATLALSCIAAVLLFAPQHLETFAESLLAATLGVSNVLFWRESGYFDLAARMKPLLHTWSLSVEWQFYCVWPLLLSGLLALFRRRMVWPILAIAVLGFWLIFAFQDGSFWLLAGTRTAEWLSDGRATVFYNMPFRVFEFACGAVLVWLPHPRALATHELLALLGLVLIGSAVFFLDDTAHAPALNVLVPTVGAAMVLYADRSRHVALVLRNGPAAYVGRISYSLYLVHWPLIVFCEYGLLRPLLPKEAVLVGFLSLALAVMMFHFVEQPYRVGRGFVGPAGLALAGLLTLSLISYSMWDGMPWRSPSAIAGGELADRSTLKSITGSRGCEDFCEFGNLQSPTKILIVGDSHVDHYTRALEELGGKEFHFLLAQAGSCYFGADLQSRPRGAVTQHCRAATEQAARWLNAGGIAAIVHAQRWPGYRNILERKADGAPVDIRNLAKLFPTMLEDISKLYTGFRGPVILIGHAPNTNLICALRPNYFSLPCPASSKVEHVAFKAAFAAFAGRHSQFQFVDPLDAICPAAECRMTNSAGHSLYVDENHLSIFGARLIVPKIIEMLRGDLTVQSIDLRRAG
ncbi:acyltransferase [Mesorhizobium sp. M4B.F.Ca.ET.190.01.1.1]|nr:acyltransferase [Mesorhizobium sp. M4B.F.Ca.ET.013.02.1.1]RVD43182.1 acyltransferase [Mesorhizobium sp. M4B.F.Ca.ET.019.03.1.1]RWF67724.1 MAG: acyltransferase [Mesorhizobium sp.]TGQ37100.1 acyltransferase [Mesorhizobium sp. M4B.F.Ca.ET.214.01.1.1]TGQ59394.1 acyltransferase [Mesorhizobium sp. M4B.F.Ca.ET.211.01.1.1]TGR15614.1 acyltransferase [Mesorhizobium sp. M4B.F.Ca.ET.200.01.1.1]TGS23489.1 acyltransferase [Mesorhizobium sp. M4B.F.Ca.ET.190.01.1.1]TGT34320.1 acyltransferase [Mesorhizobi